MREPGYFHFSTMEISRSDPDRIVAVAPKGHKDYPDGKRITALEDLKKSPYGTRSDIFMVIFQRDLGKGQHKTKQLWVYPGWSGPNFGEAGEWMIASEKKWCREENDRLIALAKIHPEYGRLLGGDS